MDSKWKSPLFVTSCGRLIFFLFLVLSVPVLCEAEESEGQRGEEVLDEAPKIVLHDIFTDRVCIHDNNMYTSGARVVMYGSEYECVNMRPNLFGDDADEGRWQMEWVPVNSP